jgi:hypothetical protein
LRIAHLLEARLTDGGEVVSLTHRPHFSPHEDYRYRLNELQGHTSIKTIRTEIEFVYVNNYCKTTLCYSGLVATEVQDSILGAIRLSEK